MSELTKWNLTLSNQLVKVPGRILPPEKIKSFNKQYDGGFDADWTKHLRCLPMYANATVSTWVIVAPQSNEREVEIFKKSLLSTADGMAFKLPKPIVLVFCLSNI